MSNKCEMMVGYVRVVSILQGVKFEICNDMYLCRLDDRPIFCC